MFTCVCIGSISAVHGARLGLACADVAAPHSLVQQAPFAYCCAGARYCRPASRRVPRVWIPPSASQSVTHRQCRSTKQCTAHGDCIGFLALSVRFSPVISPTSDFCVPKSVQPTWTLLGLLRFQLNRAPRACCPFPPWKRLITLMLRAVHRCLKVTFMPGMYPAPSYLHLLRCHALPPPLKPCLVPLPRPLHTTH